MIALRMKKKTQRTNAKNALAAALLIPRARPMPAATLQTKSTTARTAGTVESTRVKRKQTNASALGKRATKSHNIFGNVLPSSPGGGCEN